MGTRPGNGKVRDALWERQKPRGRVSAQLGFSIRSVLQIFGVHGFGDFDCFWPRFVNHASSHLCGGACAKPRSILSTEQITTPMFGTGTLPTQAINARVRIKI